MILVLLNGISPCFCCLFDANSVLHPSPLLLGGDLHYHLSQHGVFSEKEMGFYASEIILGLEHMHNRFVVYRDLKVTVAYKRDRRQAGGALTFIRGAPEMQRNPPAALCNGEVGWSKGGRHEIRNRTMRLWSA